MTRSLFFLGGASLLSGLEARRRFGVERDDAVALCSPRVADVLSPWEWRARRTVVTKARDRARAGHVARLVADVVDVVSRHGPFDELFVADLTMPMRLTAALCGPGTRVTVLDDGLAAPGFAAARRAPPPRIVDALLDPRAVRFFSAFKLRGRDGDELVDNDYRCMRADVVGRPVSGEGWIIGQPLVDNGMMDRDVYAALVARAADRLADPVYICHPNERDETVSSIARDLEVRRHQRPLEIEALQQRTRPVEVVGFYSSALPQLSLLFGTAVPVTAVRISQARLHRAHVPVAAAYGALEEMVSAGHGLSVVDEE